ncbi:MAG TPA: acetate--CoA ligase family protein [Acidimicrobiia bacterium]|jgi:acyl-CoA synthetase (NDP forming)
MARRSSLSSLFEARRIAVVGASARRGSVGDVVFRQLVVSRGRHAVIPVNPRYRELAGGPCLPALGAIDGPVDLAVLAVPDAALESELASAIRAGARSAAIFGPCRGVASDGSPLVERLGVMARTAGLPVCGGNGMGFVNVENGLTVCGFHQPAEAESGPVTLLTHSGSFFSAALHAASRLRYDLVVSTGNELATTMDEYLDYAVDRASTKVVGLFLETVRRPAALAAALERAASRDIPVVALKLGRTERGRAAVATHTAAIAGDHEACSAFLESHGVHTTDSPEELVDTLELFAAGRRAAPGGLGAINDSGGERTLLIDTADELGVPLPSVAADTAARLVAVLDEGLEPENPVDAWGTGRGANDVFESSFLALADDQNVGVLAYVVDLTPEEDEAASYVGVLTRTSEKTTKPVTVLASLAAAVDPGQAGRLRGAGIPVLGSRTGLLAVRHLLDHRDRRPGREPSTVAAPAAARWASRLERGGVLEATEGLELLADFGIPVVATVACAGRDAAVEAAGSIGYPVVLKTAASVAHKSDVGGVVLGLADQDGVAAAYDRLAALGPEVLVQAMAPDGVEIAVGVLADPQFGPVVVVAAGGTLVEVLEDRYAALPPIDADAAERLLRRLRVARLLDGHRSRPAAAVAEAASVIASVSALAAAIGDRLAGLDINPIIVGTEGAVAVDALVIARDDAGPDIVKSSEEGERS